MMHLGFSQKKSSEPAASPHTVIGRKLDGGHALFSLSGIPPELFHASWSELAEKVSTQGGCLGHCGADGMPPSHCKTLIAIHGDDLFNDGKPTALIDSKVSLTWT